MPAAGVFLQVKHEQEFFPKAGITKGTIISVAVLLLRVCNVHSEGASNLVVVGDFGLTFAIQPTLVIVLVARKKGDSELSERLLRDGPRRPSAGARCGLRRACPPPPGHRPCANQLAPFWSQAVGRPDDWPSPRWPRLSKSRVAR